MTSPLSHKPVPLLNPSFREAVSSDIQHEAPLPQLEDISSCSITISLGAETVPRLAATSFQGVVDSNTFPLSLLFFR